MHSPAASRRSSRSADVAKNRALSQTASVLWMSFFFSFLSSFKRKKKETKKKAKGRWAKREMLYTNCARGAWAQFAAGILSAALFFFALQIANGARCLGSVCVWRCRLLFFVSLFFCFFSFLEKKRREKPQTAPAFWVPFVLKVVFILFPFRLFFASFFSPKRKKRKNQKRRFAALFFTASGFLFSAV